MATRAMLRGYLLEEALAWLLRHSGYRLLVNAEQDPEELVSDGGNLRVRGRGAVHQVDVLGEFAFTPAFSLPVRLFLEAKYYRTPCRLEVVRNAHGVIHDVNENFMNRPGSRPRRRYQYSYALFSANGFTSDAQEYALAHQISLIDLSGESFTWLLEAIKEAAQDLYTAQVQHHVTSFPVSWMRAELRQRLDTGPLDLLPVVNTGAPGFRAAAKSRLADFVASLTTHHESELLLGFPAAPFVLPLAASDAQQFMNYADTHPDHVVRLRRTGQNGDAEWTVSPREPGGGYLLTFKLPEQIEDWISDNAEKERQRTMQIKSEFLAGITVYRMVGAGVRSYQLRYEPSELRR
ncbi:restriction endonuclease [Yinghuangia soli]|uniref:Restriction endonuclease n=1 Tax=Yinghuangia soli TaxID=2908204 RepID=A0AA41PVE9_9ACTN|nr:restriction endonuclease [Yinghuangia soli]MCF2525906.1 restriction endonuclease [Yinghuangia soli]